MTTQYEAVIGLEVHAQLSTATKLFCGCSTEYGAPPNTQICPVCLGLPGSLPVPNQRAIELAVVAGIALECDVATTSRFARKNYFYPDLPKGYQISQFDEPLNLGGSLTIEVNGVEKTIGITRIHVEEDAAKNLHGVAGGSKTVVDYNRGGTPLIEIVSEPDLRSADEAEAYLRKLRDILMFVGVNDGNLEEGSFRCDANVSIRPVGQEKFGTRAEIKNVNSFRFVHKAIEYEILRQQAVLDGGGVIVQETRTWSDPQGKTLSMRGKEDAHDYRYFPCPDLPPLMVAAERIAELQATLPILPEQQRLEWVRDCGLTDYDAQVLTGHPKFATYFNEAVSALTRTTGKPHAEWGKQVANFVQAEVLAHVSTDGLEATFPVPAAQLADLFRLIDDGTINNKIAKTVFLKMLETGKSAKTVVDQEGLAQVTDTAAIEKAVDEVLAANVDKVAQYKAGKDTLMGFFVGQVMRATRGAANPQLVNEILQSKLSR